MQPATHEAAAFFPDDDRDEISFPAIGYLPQLISVFDHVLTAAECDACGVMFYEEAAARGKLAEYDAGEARFLAFYRALAKDGAYLHRDGKYWRTSADDTDFTAALINSLRESHPDDLMDVYFIGPAIRACGGFDRTDLLLLRDKAFMPQLKDLARQHKLYLLPTNDHGASAGD